MIQQKEIRSNITRKTFSDTLEIHTRINHSAVQMKQSQSLRE